MATFAVGDIQGCFDSFESLVESLELGDDDRLWLVGDLVNRGPKSAEVLRFARDLGKQCISVLGNHDLHLLAMAAGLREPKSRDTAQTILDEKDADELIDWLRHRPLAYKKSKRLLVHAGVHPSWSTKEALDYAAELETALRSDDWDERLAELYGTGKETLWSDDLEGGERLQAIAAVFTRIRCVRDKGDDWVLDHRYDGPPSEAGKELVPWFEVDKERKERVVFGHWAALGLLIEPGHVALDTGCVWGDTLTAVCLDDDEVFTQPAIDDD